MAIPEKGSTRYWSYLEDNWPCAGGLWAVNAIGTQLRDPNDKIGSNPMGVGGINESTPSRKSGGIP